MTDDLTAGWDTPWAQRSARALSDLLARHARGSASDADVGAFLRAVPALDRLEHPLIRAYAERDELLESLRTTSVETVSGPVATFTAEGWRGTVLLRADLESGQDVAWLVAARPDDGPAESDLDPGAVPQDSDELIARIERAAERREDWKTELDRTTRALLAETLATGDAGPVPVAVPAHGRTPLFDLTLSLQGADGEEPAQVIVIIAPRESAPEATVGVGTRTVLAAIAADAVAWTAAPVAGHAMSYAATIPVPSSMTPPADPEPGRMAVGTLAHYAPTAGLTEATLSGSPVQALCGHWFVPMHDHVTRPTCERCAALRDTLS